MLDLQRHIYCPIWTNTVQPEKSPCEADFQWSDLKYVCHAVLEIYSKVIDKQELFDLIVRYTNIMKN